MDDVLLDGSLPPPNSQIHKSLMADLALHPELYTASRTCACASDTVVMIDPYRAAHILLERIDHAHPAAPQLGRTGVAVTMVTK